MVVMGVTAVSAAFGLKGNQYLYKICTEAMEHLLDNMIGSDAENLVSNFSRQMPISQMPSQAHELIRIFVPDFDYRLRSSLNFEPPPIFKLQAISICHRDRSRKVEKDIFALICSQANAAAIACFKIKRENACRLFLRPNSRGAMN